MQSLAFHVHFQSFHSDFYFFFIAEIQGFDQNSYIPLASSARFFAKISNDLS